jgi:hypothetical protein
VLLQTPPKNPLLPQAREVKSQKKIKRIASFILTRISNLQNLGRIWPIVSIVSVGAIIQLKTVNSFLLAIRKKTKNLLRSPAK